MKIRNTIFFILFISNAVCAEEVQEQHSFKNPYREQGVPIQLEQVKKQALFVRNTLVQRGEVSASWGKASITDVKERMYKNEKEWVVTLYNAEEKNSKKQNLFVFMDPLGDIVDVNFDGK